VAQSRIPNSQVNEPASERLVLLVTSDLMARERVRSAASQSAMGVRYAAPGSLVEALRTAAPDVLVVDLDAGGAAILQEVAAARAEDVLPERVLGYFSHVDTALGEAAEQAGVEAVRRGRFWSSLPELLAE
jgi:DNA-binding NarL/FixJ family response regulator